MGKNTCAVLFLFFINCALLISWIFQIYFASTLIAFDSTEFHTSLWIFCILILISQWAYCKAKCSDPGISHESILGTVLPNIEDLKTRSRVLLRDEILLKKLIKEKYLDLNDINNLSHRPEKPITKEKLKAQLEQLRAYKSTHVTYCYECDQFKAVRTHHCSICESCVTRMDHHCQFLGVCIGKHNHRYFMQYLGWTFITLVYMILHLLWMEQSVNKRNKEDWRLGLLYGTIGIAGFFALYTFCLWIGQCKRGCRNITMIEDMTGKVGDTFDTGSCCMNLAEIYHEANCCTFCLPFGSIAYVDEDGRSSRGGTQLT